MAKMNLEQLRKLRDKMQPELQRRDPEGKSIQVIVGMGTCGIAAGAKNTLETFVKVLGEKGLNADVCVRQTGCMGKCGNEPTVEVIVPKMATVVYGNVNADVAKEIVEQHIIGKKLLDSKIIEKKSKK